LGEIANIRAEETI